MVHKKWLCLLLALALALSAACALGEDEPTSRYKLYELKVFEKANADILEGLNLLRVKFDNQSGYALYDLNSNALTEAVYYGMSGTNHGLVQVRNGDGMYGILNKLGEQIIPCEYDDIKICSNRWQIGIKLALTEGEPYDYKSFFSSSDKYYIVTQYDVYYRGALIKTLARDDYDLSTSYAYGDYLYIRNRAKESFFYDKEFNATSVTSSQEYATKGADIIHLPTGQKAFCAECTLDIDSVGNPYRYIKSINAFVDVNGNEALKLDRVYYSVSDFVNGYATVQEIDTFLYGVIDTNGNIVIPCEYDSISYTGLFSSEYQQVRNGDNYGYYNKDGVLTCPTEYSYKSAKEYGNKGMIYVDMNSNYKYVSPAKGMLEQEFKEVRFLYATAAPVMVVTNHADEVGLMDVYGDMVLPYQKISSYNIQVSYNAEAVLVKKDGKAYVYGVEITEPTPPVDTPNADELPEDAAEADAPPEDTPDNDDNAVQPSDGTWICDCGSQNTSKFCPECGAAKPPELVTACPNCQTEASDPQNPPKFCPECGTKMN